MSERDRHRHARISSHRLTRFAVRVDKLTAEAWWQQIVAAAADLGLEPGTQAEWR